MGRGRGRTAQSRTAHSLAPPPLPQQERDTPHPMPPPSSDRPSPSFRRRCPRNNRPEENNQEVPPSPVQSKRGRGLFPKGRWPMDILCKRPADTSHRRHPCRHIWTESFKPCVNLTSRHAFIAAFITAAAAVQTDALPYTASCPSSNHGKPLAASSRFFSSLPGAADKLPV